MDFGLDEEILQDFMVEAGEIHEQLGQQLVDLEDSPNDSGLINAIFRAFHTIKGGAAFLQLTHLVSLCHKAEDAFDLVREGRLLIDESSCSLFLDVHDILGEMFAALESGADMQPAPDSMFNELKVFMSKVNASTKPDESQEEDPDGSEEIFGETDSFEDEFDKISSANIPDSPTSSSAPTENESVEDEFERILAENMDQGSNATESIDDEFERILAENSGQNETPETPPPSTPKKITDDEFENILDDMYGEGKFDQESTPMIDISPSATPIQSPSTKPSPVATKPKATPKKPNIDSSVRVDIKVLDHIMNMVGELVLVRNRLVTLENGKDSEELPEEEYREEVEKSIANLDVVTSDLQLAVMKTRMQPIKRVFGRFPRVVRDLAKRLGKNLRVVMEGENTDLDKNLVEELADPLIHLIRNSADHGIEMPDIREAAGKDSRGTITLAACQQGDSIVLTISDDGAGINPEVIKKIAIEREVITVEESKRLSDTETFNLIFLPGFSTTTETTDVSGRGVGMDVVKTKISQLNGSIVIESAMGKGTSITIRVPLTLAIMPTLTVRVGPQFFALPLANVKEILSLDNRPTNNVDGKRLLPLRDRTIPLFYLKHWLIDGSDIYDHPSTGHVVVVEVNSEQVGFIVDGLIGQEEVVIKPLGDALKSTPGLAGATITGNGKVSIILDLQDLIQANA